MEPIDLTESLAEPEDHVPWVPGAKLVVVSGPDRGRSTELTDHLVVVGKEPGCAIALADQAISRRHLEIEVSDGRILIRDLGSKNGSYYQGARFAAIAVGLGACFKIGSSELMIVGPDEPLPVELWEGEQFGDLVGTSVAMRRVFALLARFAATDGTVLIRGETGTGKELAAHAIHAHSDRAARPFIVGDLGSVSGGLIESELFGHLRGAFSGADRDRSGLFALAGNGTIFLDEIGELPLSDQPRLLRALDQRTFRPVGGGDYLPIEARLVAATNRDLSAEVTAGRFREDLYHRLAVLVVEIPPLRTRRDDIPLLANQFVARAAARAGVAAPAIPPGLLAHLVAHDWPGNVRQLRNVLDRAVALTPPDQPLDATTVGLTHRAAPPSELRAAVAADASTLLPFHEAKHQLIDAWERDYIATLIHKAGGNMSLAARTAGMSRMSLYRMLHKHGHELRGDDLPPRSR